MVNSRQHLLVHGIGVGNGGQHALRAQIVAEGQGTRPFGGGTPAGNGRRPFEYLPILVGVGISNVTGVLRSALIQGKIGAFEVHTQKAGPLCIPPVGPLINRQRIN